MQTLPQFLSEQMGRPQLALTLGALLLCVFLSGLDSSIVANALPPRLGATSGVSAVRVRDGVWAGGQPAVA